MRTGTIREQIHELAKRCATFFEFTEAIEAWATERWGEAEWHHRFNSLDFSTTLPLLEIWGLYSRCRNREPVVVGETLRVTQTSSPDSIVHPPCLDSKVVSISA